MTLIQGDAVNSRVREKLRRMFVTVGGIALYWAGAQIPTPAVDKAAYLELLESKAVEGAPPLSLTGGLSPTVFGLGVIPFLTAMLLFGLMGRLVPRLSELTSEGPAGRLRYLILTRRTSILIALISATVSASATVRGTTDAYGFPVGILRDGVFNIVVHIGVLVAGFLALLVVAEYMTRNGVGNGVMILTVATVLGQQLPGFRSLLNDEPAQIVLYIATAILSAAILVVATTARHITRYHGVLPTGSSSIPSAGAHVAKVAGASAGPVLFASSSLSVVALLASQLNSIGVDGSVATALRNPSSTASLVAFGVLTVVFARFYAVYGTDPVREANELTRSGRFIQNRTPGVETARWYATVAVTTSWSYAALLLPVMTAPVVSKLLGLPSVLLGGGIIIPVLVTAEILLANSKTLSNYSNKTSRR